MQYTVKKHMIIGANYQEILKYLADMNNWSRWSPWDCLDPEALIKSTADFMSWDGKFIGVGNIEVTLREEQKIFFDLNFIKPFKSSAKVEFNLDKLLDKSTNLVWTMNSSLPFFLFFFKKLFEVMIGRDFERGLTRLKYLSETGNVPSKLEFTDTVIPQDGFKIVGVGSRCHMSNISDSMHKSFAKLDELVKKSQITPIKMVCLCDKVKISKEIMDYTAAVVYTDTNNNLGELVKRDIPSHKAIKVTLYGSYEFMGDAWSGLYTHFRGLKLKQDKRVPPYEVYIKGPHNCNDKEQYITEVYMPVR